MSIFGSILSKIFHHGEAQAAPAPQGTSAPPGTSATPGTAPAVPPATGGTPTSPSAPQASAPASAPGASVDVAAILDGLSAKNSQKLDWKHSIVDMLKLLDMDSSLTARKELAQELHYAGSTDDSATMNLWLHKQVMQKIADNGGKVPDDLKN